MSYSIFFSEQVKQFRQQYPESNGWQIFTTARSVLHKLPQFLEKNPGTEKHSELVRSFRGEILFKPQSDAPEIKVNQKGWLGRYTICWKEAEICIASLHTPPQLGSTFLVAAKDFTALRTFYMDIFQFSQQQERNKSEPCVNAFDGTVINIEGATWDKLILPQAMADDLRFGVETFFKAKEEYKQFGLPYKRGFIFTGPAGCGKTMAAKAIIATMRLPAYLLAPGPGMELNTAAITWAFSSAASQAPSVILIEELEKYSESAYISMVLNLMDGLATMKGVLVIATTNYPEKIDPALLLRPSRFDRVWQFSLPEEEARFRFLQKKAGVQFGDKVLKEVASLSSGFSMAYVQEILASALSLAMRDNRKMSAKDLITSVNTLKKQIKTAAYSSSDLGKSSLPLGFAQV